jgi:putative hemolysin
MDGLLAIDEVKEALGLEELPEENRVGFQTLGGFMMTMLDHIPEAGDSIDVLSLRFEVMDMDGRRVDKVLVSPVPKQNDEPPQIIIEQ